MGDAAGRRLPVMTDLVDVVGLQHLVEEVGRDYTKESNFEAIYGQLALEPSHLNLLGEIERRVDEYFAALSLPSQANLYDRLLVSLRPKDAVFTFNWDPYLFDAYQRNRVAVPLPEIFFLHGNVRIGACASPTIAGALGTSAVRIASRPWQTYLCSTQSNGKTISSDPYIHRIWEAANILFKEALTLTIFGYDAPTRQGCSGVATVRVAGTKQSNLGAH